MIDLLVTLCSMVFAFVMFVVLFFVMHWNLLICMGLAIVLYFALTLLLKPTERIGGVKISSLENGEELKDRLGEAKAEYGRIQKAAERITDFELQKRSLQLQDRAGNILHYLFVDMNRFAELIRNDTKWSDIGVLQLYGKISVDTTDPAKSNSGNMFAALLANVLNGGETVTRQNLAEVLPKLQSVFGKLGYMETSSADLFSQFLKLGVGAKPIIAGYESQLIEYAAEKPGDYTKIKDDIVVLYPAPTVWSSHVMIALDDAGTQLLDALLDEEI